MRGYRGKWQQCLPRVSVGERFLSARRLVGGVGWRLLALGLLALACRSGAEKGAKAVDANAVVRQMIATYQAATTIQDTAETKFVLPGGRQFYQTNTIKFKQPYLIAITSEDPDQGMLSAHANGLTVTFYTGKQNVYIKVSVPKSLRKVVTEIDTSILQMLSPLSFLMAKGMPREAQGFRYGGAKTVEGHKTHLIFAQASDAWVKKTTPAGGFKSVKRDLALYIDVDTHLLVKAQVALVSVRTIPAKGKTPAQQEVKGFGFEEIHRSTILNAPLPDSVFTFDAPKNAKEIFREGR